MEHVACGEFGLSLLVHIPLGAFKIAVAADDLLCLGVPHDELLVAVLARVELVDVHVLARAAARLTEGNLTQTPDLLHHVRCVVRGDDVDFVVALVSHAELAFGCQLLFEDFFVDGGDDLLFHF